MYVSLNWLRDFVDIPADVDAEALGRDLTLRTAEVEGVRKLAEGLDGVVIGELIEFKKHPDADKLNVAKVNTGKKEPLNLIFGSMIEMNIGDKVPVAVAPTVLPTGVPIEKRKMRGEISEGMLCLDQELGLAKEGVSIQYFPEIEPGTPFVEAAKLDDVILEFDNKSLTNRPDLWGHYGMAREVAVLTGSALKEYDPQVEIPEKGESVDVKVENEELCPRYSGLIIENVKVGESPEWLKERLKAVGHGIHNNIVDVTNFVMVELGQPMHAFDREVVKGGIVVRNAKASEKLRTLDGKEHELSEEMLVIADHEKVVAVAGVMGGEHSGISEKTTAIILEAANFDAVSVRKTSTKLGLRSDSVQRFEKSLDAEMTEKAIRRAAEIVLEICPGAKIAGPMTDLWEKRGEPLKIDLDLKRANLKIGVEIEEKQAVSILESLGFGVEGKNGLFTVTVPSWRATKDVENEGDLVEEIARIYGYENIEPTLPELPAKLPDENAERFKKHRLRELLSYGLGYDEVYNYSFYGRDDLEKCLMSEEGHLYLENVLSEDQTHLRYSLVPNLMKNLVENVKYFDELRIYEIGRTYRDVAEFFPLEEKRMTGAVLVKNGEDPFAEAKGVLEAIWKKFRISDLKEAKGISEKVTFAHPGRAVCYLHAGDTIGEVFALHPLVQRNYELEKYKIAFFCVNFTKMTRLPVEEKRFEAIPKFPGIDFDVSVLIDSDVEVGGLREAIMTVDELVQEASLFDIYEGKGVPEGKKAVAYRINLQAKDRTLTDEEMTQVQKKVFEALTKIGGEIRGG